MAKRFKFSLEALLKIRSQSVETRKSELGKVVSLKEKRLQDVQDLEQANIANNHNFPGSGQVIYAMAYANHKKRIEKEKQDIIDEIKKIEEVEKERRKNLNLALQDEKVIEKLREKQYAEYLKELNKEEMDFLNEIASRTGKK